MSDLEGTESMRDESQTSGKAKQIKLMQQKAFVMEMNCGAVKSVKRSTAMLMKGSWNVSDV